MLKDKLKIKNNKGIVEKIGTFAIGIAITAVILGLMATVLNTMRDSSCGTTGNVACTGNSSVDVLGFSYNASQNGLTGINTFSTYLPTVALVLVAALIIGIIVTYFYVKGRGSS